MRAMRRPCAGASRSRAGTRREALVGFAGRLAGWPGGQSAWRSLGSLLALGMAGAPPALSRRSRACRMKHAPPPASCDHPRFRAWTLSWRSKLAPASRPGARRAFCRTHADPGGALRRDDQEIAVCPRHRGDSSAAERAGICRKSLRHRRRPHRQQEFCHRPLAGSAIAVLPAGGREVAGRDRGEQGRVVGRSWKNPGASEKGQGNRRAGVRSGIAPKGRRWSHRRCGGHAGRRWNDDGRRTRAARSESGSAWDYYRFESSGRRRYAKATRDAADRARSRASASPRAHACAGRRQRGRSRSSRSCFCATRATEAHPHYQQPAAAIERAAGTIPAAASVSPSVFGITPPRRPSCPAVFPLLYRTPVRGSSGSTGRAEIIRRGCRSCFAHPPASFVLLF